MKVNTNLKSGSAIDSAWKLVVDSGDYAVGFLKEAEYQAVNLTQAVTGAANNIWQGVTGLFR